MRPKADTEPQPEERTTRPALDILDADQDRLLYYGDEDRVPPFKPLSDGFGTLWELLVWYQAAGIRTLGHIEEVLPPAKIQPNRPVVRYLLQDRPESAYVQQRLVESVDQACDLAYAHLRKRAEETVRNDDQMQSSALHNSDDNQWDVRETNPAMRPAFRKLDEQQAAAIHSLLSGFEERSDLSRWVRSLTAPTAGEKPEDLMPQIIRSKPLLRALMEGSKEAKLTRYRFAVSVLLPPFLKAARTLRGGETSETDSNFGPQQG